MRISQTHMYFFCRVATVPGKAGNPGKTSLFQISPGKPCEQSTFQDSVLRKPGKYYTLMIA